MFSLLALMMAFPLIVLSLIEDTTLPTLSQALTLTPNISSFTDLLTNSFPDVFSILSSQQESLQPITILVPSDDAFKRIPNSALGPAFMANDTELIRNALLYHVLPGNHPSTSFTQSFQFLPTWLVDAASTNVSGGQRVGVVVQGEKDVIFVSGTGTRSNVDQADIGFSGGTLHVINMPVIPPQNFRATAEVFNLTAFLGAVYQNSSIAQLVEDQHDITIFAPSNDALQAVGSTVIALSNENLSILVQYHILVTEDDPYYTTSLTNGSVWTTLQGGSLIVRMASNSIFINSARVLQSDLLVANGVMHVLDSVLNPNETAALPNPALPTQQPALTGSGIVDTPFTSDIPISSSMALASEKISDGSTSDAAGTGGSAAPSTTPSAYVESTTKEGGALGKMKCLEDKGGWASRLGILEVVWMLTAFM